MAPHVKEWSLIELPTVPYKEAWRLQQDIVAGKHKGNIKTDVLLLLEHPPVFTVGRRGGTNNLKVSENFLKEKNISVVEVERGGDITYHGPGQLVGYPIINLLENKLGIPEFTNLIEEVMIRTAKTMGVDSSRNAKNAGIWTGKRKLGSIGIAIRHGISFHGFSLNIDLSLEPFGWINPCGFNDIQMTSLKKESLKNISMTNARKIAKTHIETVFNIRLRDDRVKSLFLTNHCSITDYLPFVKNKDLTPY